jgi:hypothetical protein
MQEQTMNKTLNQKFMHHFQSWGYQLFKYLVYGLLAINVYLFFAEEWLASNVVFAAGISFGTIIEAFSSTIDTGTWLVLLLLFELETSVIEDEDLVGLTKWSLHIIRGLCYIIILYAFYGYLTKVGLLDQFSLHQATDLCTLGKEWKFMETLNVYNEFTAETCRALSTANTEFFYHAKYNVIADLNTLNDVKMLAFVDVINSAAWISVVIMLEIDVHTQLGNISSKWWDKYNIFVKVSVYGVLFIAAIYWGVTGNFLEFWDAFLWIVAFVLIEMNMFEWQAEVAERKKQAKLAKTTENE